MLLLLTIEVEFGRETVFLAKSPLCLPPCLLFSEPQPDAVLARAAGPELRLRATRAKLALPMRYVE